MSPHEIPTRPRPEDRRRADAEPAPAFDAAGLLPPWLRSEAFAEDLPEETAAA